MPDVQNTLPALLPTLHALSRADKLRVIQQMAADLAQEEGVPFFESGATYPVWTPLGAYEGAATLLQMLETERSSP